MLHNVILCQFSKAFSVNALNTFFVSNIRPGNKIFQGRSVLPETEPKLQLIFINIISLLCFLSVFIYIITASLLLSSGIS